jgi:hypothetical protein
VVEHKDMGRHPDIETRKRKEDGARTTAIEDAKLAQQQAEQSGPQQSNDPKQRQRNQ